MAFDYPNNFAVGNSTQGIEGVGSLFQYAQYATDGWFGSGVVFMIFVMVFGVSALLNIGKAFASASFVAFVFSVYLARIGAINPTIPFVLILMTIAGFFWAKSEKVASY